MDRLTRKELKSDKFALEVEHTVEYVSEHRKQVIRYCTAGAIVLLLVFGTYGYRRRQHTLRQEALAAALEIYQAPLGPSPSELIRSFPTAQDKEKAAAKAFTDVATKYAGSDEGTIARYYLGIVAADGGRLADAEKALKEVADSGEKNYASLAKLPLAEIYKSEGKTAEGEKVLRSLIAKPTDFVSKDQATIALARLLASSNPAEARKLLEPLRTTRGAVSRTALTALSELPPQP